MTNKINKIIVPDLGGADEVTIIEILVNKGDKVEAETPLLTLESDKATMEVPSPGAGTIGNINIKVGDKVSEGDTICDFSSADASPDSSDSSAEDSSPEDSSAEDSSPEESKNKDDSKSKDDSKNKPAAAVSQAVIIPDIGGAQGVSVIEWLVNVGDEVTAEQPLLTLEGDKATMEVPSPFSGKIEKQVVAVGATVSEGDQIATILTGDAQTTSSSAAAPGGTQEASSQPAQQSSSSSAASASSTSNVADGVDDRNETEKLEDFDAGDVPDDYSLAGVYAGPAVRRIAREFGVDLTLVKGGGRKGRIRKVDVQSYVKRRLQTGAAPQAGASGASAGNALTIAPAPKVDFAKFGEIERVPLTRIQKISGRFLHRNWVSIPHITQFGQADITDMEAFRQSQKEAAKKQGVRLTPLAFIMKAVVAALQEFPKFNASLDAGGEHIIVKKYYNIGVAVDTPTGLVVAVVRDVDKKGILELGKELADISLKAREKGLTPAEMQGGTFSISSLGGIGGTAFTPIVNAPEVAILGVSKSSMQPVYQDGEFKPRLMLPLSLSYDHRVIDGAVGARFIVYLQSRLTDIETQLL